VLPPAARAALGTAVGAAHVAADRASRIHHACGRGYLDLVRIRRGDATGAPDGVVRPATHDEVLAVLRACDEHRVAVVPFGGGTSVVGGVAPAAGGHRAVVALDLRRMSRLVSVDRTALTATFEPGMRGPEAERLLGAVDLTLGHFPQSYRFATLGGYAATRSVGQASSGYGGFADLVEGLRVATPAGSLDLGRAPATAAGPDLRALLVGSEGTLGVLTELTLRVRPAPEARLYEGWSFPTFEAGRTALRQLAQAGAPGALPDVARLSDAEETRTTLALSSGGATRLLRSYLARRGHARGSLLITGWEGAARHVAGRRAAAGQLLRDAGGLRLGQRVGRTWEKGRFDGPTLRDGLLDAGALVETLETATSWSGLGTLYGAVRAALHASLSAHGTPPLVLCHLSHVYPSGASVYFTVVAVRDDAAPEVQWHAAKRAAGDAIAAHRATITHHHAVGVAHLPWMRDEIGDLGIAALRAVKQRLDPNGVLNPGKLIPPGS
ncbi:MAG: FAD-binding oxidoreductase, partial [Carbonactinosporaceae bacterium]